MEIIALLTDFGTKDTYVAEMKAAIYNRCENVTIIDVTHAIEAQNVRQAAFLLGSTYKHFPEDTIFVVVVDPGVGTDRKMIAASAEGRIFIGPDNGILCFLNTTNDREIFEIETSWYWADDVSMTFHGRDIFAPIAAHIANGVKLSNFGPPKKLVKECPGLKPVQENGNIDGDIIWIDNFGNAVSNIPSELINYKAKNQEISILIEEDGAEKYQIIPMFTNFTEATEENGDKLFCFVGSKKFIEFAVPGGSAADKYNIATGTKVKVQIKK